MRRGAGLLVIVLSTSLALAGIEVVLRAFPRLGASPSTGRELKWRERHAVATDRLTRAGGVVDRYSPTLGWDIAPLVRAEGISTNKDGLRGATDYTPDPPPGVRRVLCLGDSFTFGEHLTDDQTFPFQLEVALNRTGRWEVLNLGVHGYGTDQQWLRLQELGFGFASDIVLLGLYEEDVRRNTLSFRDFAKPYFEVVDGRLVLRNVPISPPEEVLARPFVWPPCRSYLWCTAQWIAETLAFDLPVPRDMEWTTAGQVTLAILDQMREAVSARGMVFVLMTIPAERDLRPSATKIERMCERWAARTGTPMINLRRAYLTLPAEDRERLYAGHWTPYGAAETARMVADRLPALLHDLPPAPPAED